MGEIKHVYFLQFFIHFVYKWSLRKFYVQRGEFSGCAPHEENLVYDKLTCVRTPNQMHFLSENTGTRHGKIGIKFPVGKPSSRSSWLFQVIISLQLLYSDLVVNIVPIWVIDTLSLRKTLKLQDLRTNNNLDDIINLCCPFKITNNNLKQIYSWTINLSLYPFL